MTTQAELDARYGRTSRSRVRAGWIAVAIVAVLAVAGIGWTTIASALDDVAVDDLGFSVSSEHDVEVSFQFTAPAGRDVVCVLEALDEEFGVVGFRVVEYAATDSHAQRHREVVPTIAQATTGLVNSCRVS